MHSQLFGIVALYLCLMSLPCMVYTIPLHQFYRYGRRAGDAVLPRNDDGVSPPIPLGSSGFRFYRNLHSSIFVSLVFEGESFFFEMLMDIIEHSLPLATDSLVLFNFLCRSIIMGQYPLMEACLVIHPSLFQ